MIPTGGSNQYVGEHDCHSEGFLQFGRMGMSIHSFCECRGTKKPQSHRSFAYAMAEPPVPVQRHWPDSTSAE